MHNITKALLTFGGLQTIDLMEKNAKKQFIVPFLKMWTMRLELKEKIHETWIGLKRVQRQFKNQIVIRKARLEVLQICWKRTLGKIQNQLQKDKYTKLIGKCLILDPYLRDELISDYLTQCKLKYIIAYYQHRIRHKPQSDHNEIKRIIATLVKHARTQNGRMEDLPKEFVANPEEYMK